jgi:hypothetical protein
MTDYTMTFAKALSQSWLKYKNLFESVPHGTAKQLAALLELTPEWERITERLGRLEGLDMTDEMLLSLTKKFLRDLGFKIEEAPRPDVRKPVCCGTYISRMKNNGFSEFWNTSGKWAGSGYMFTDVLLADAVLRLLKEKP